MKWRQLITDPSSKELSMSRFCFGLLILAILAVSVGLMAGYKIKEAADLLQQALLITAGLYGANSVAGAITHKPCEPDKPQEGGPVG